MPVKEPHHVDLKLRSYLCRWWQGIIQLDSEFWVTLRQLISCPGALAERYFEPWPAGQRQAIGHPIRVYLTVNIIFFFLAPWLNTDSFTFFRADHAAVADTNPAMQALLERSIERSGVERALFETILDERMNSRQGTWVFILIPVAALAAMAVAWRRRRFLVEHLVFATHIVSFLMIALLVFGVAVRLLLVVDDSSKVSFVIAIGLVLAFIGWILLTIYRSIRTFYDYQRRWQGLAMTAWIGAALMLGGWLSSSALFLTCLFSLRGLTA